MRPVSYTHLDVYKRQAYVQAGNPVSVAVNGATGSEAFLAAALFGSMGAGDQLKLTPYQSAAEACLLYTSRCV